MSSDEKKPFITNHLGGKKNYLHSTFSTDYVTPIDPRGRKADIVDASGYVCKATAVSKDSPDFFKSPLLTSSPDFFEKAVKQTNVDYVPAGLPQGYAHERVAVAESTDVQFKAERLVSTGSPTFMQSPLTSNEAHFESKGVPVKSMKEIAPPMHGKAHVYNEAGVLKKSTRNSQDVPDFMRAPMDANREYYLKKGFGDCKTHTPSLNLSGQGQEPCRKDKIMNEQTGAISSNFYVSRQAPGWMKSPLRSNREHFEEAGVRDKLRQVKHQFPPETGKKRISDSTHHVSETAPEWMQAGNGVKMSLSC